MTMLKFVSFMVVDFWAWIEKPLDRRNYCINKSLNKPYFMLIKSFKATHQVSKELSLKHCLNYLFELRDNQVVVSASSICHAIAVLTVLSEFITSEICFNWFQSLPLFHCTRLKYLLNAIKSFCFFSNWRNRKCLPALKSTKSRI